MLRLRKHDPGHGEAGSRTQEQGQPVLIKLFKNVPKMDVDMLLPGTRVRLNWLDRCKIMLPTLSGIALAVLKIVKGAVVFAFAGVYSLLLLLVFVIGTLGYGVKSFFGYLQTKDKYHLHLTRNLYYQNLDNNAGVLTRMLLEAEEQEFREAVLAFALLRRAGDEGLTEAQLDREAELWLYEQLGSPVDFESGDALLKLSRANLIERSTTDRYHAVSVAEAMRRIDAIWDGWFSPSERYADIIAAPKERPRRVGS
jgi:hypothetical protein